MPAFLDTIFGKKKPTAATAADELAKVEAALVAAPGRIARAKAVLARVADLSDAEHEAALANLGAEERAVVRLEAQAVELRKAHAEAKTAEEAASLRARAEAARKSMAEMAKLLNRLEETYPPVVAAAKAIAAIESEVDSVNYEIAAAKKAGRETPEPVKTAQELFRSEPDYAEPDTTSVDRRWRFPDGRAPSVFIERDGKMVPQEGGAEPYEIKRVTPGRVRRGRSIASPLVYLCLPATRLSGKTHWPRGA